MVARALNTHNINQEYKLQTILKREREQGMGKEGIGQKKQPTDTLACEYQRLHSAKTLKLFGAMAQQAIVTDYEICHTFCYSMTRLFPLTVCTDISPVHSAAII